MTERDSATRVQGLEAGSGWRLRALRVEDAAAAAEVIREAFAAQRLATDPPPSALRETATSVAAHLKDGGGAALEADGALIGLVLWAERDGGLYLGRLAVLPAWRGRGAARALIAASEAEGRKRGLPRLNLRVRLVLDDNRRLFSSCGFVATKQGAHPGYAEPTYQAMEKRLG